VAIVDVAAAFDDDVGMGFEQADELRAGRDRLAGQDPTLGLGDDPLDQRLIVAAPGLPEIDGQVGGFVEPPCRLGEIGERRLRDPDQLAVELNAFGSAAGELDRPRPLLRRAQVIAPRKPDRSNASV